MSNHQKWSGANVENILEEMSCGRVPPLRSNRTLTWRVRAYEQENKNRDGVPQEIDRRLNAAS